uniref:Uncharacterized protein n=1 Tax=Kalanchoe fedtschenkoi TaxID=63787 RepID=A0A7N0UP41_KALFE
MAVAARSLVKSATGRCSQFQALRWQSSLAAKQHKYHEETHVYENPNKYLGSWNAPRDPKEAEEKLALLRRDYAKKMKETRKVYIHEMEVQRLEKERQDAAKKEAMLKANEERRKLKAAAAEVRAAERKVADEQFRQALIKERAEKLDNWRMKEKQRKMKKKEKNDMLRAQSAAWIEESQLERKIMEAIVDSTPL